MRVEPRRIPVAADSELGPLLDEAEERPLLLDRDGAIYRLERVEDDASVGSDPEAICAALDATAGSWSDLDVDKLIADVYRARAEGSRPADRP